MAGRWIFILLFSIGFFVPSSAFAAVTITEIMYDPPGSNAGHQWLQIYNNGSTEVDLHGYKLFQNGTNHGLSVVNGTTTLAAGQVAIIANNPSTFLSDFPAYIGTLYKASFSLRAAGDSVVLKDVKLNAVDTAVYGSALGGKGDGNALYRSRSSWVPGSPQPDSYHTAPPPAIAAEPAAPTPKPARSKSSSNSARYSAPSSPMPDQVASPAPAGGYPLLEIVAGSAAFGIVVIAGMLFSARFAPQPQSVPAAAEPTKKEADEYEIIESGEF